MTVRIRGWLFVILYCYLMYPFYIKGGENYMRIVYYLIIIAPVLRGLFHVNRPVHISTLRIFMVGSMVSLVVVYLFNTVLQSANDFSLLSGELLPATLRTLSKISIMYIWAEKYSHKKVNIDFYEIMLRAILLYILGTTVFITFPKLRDSWNMLIAQPESLWKQSRAEGYLTRFGFGGFSGFEVGFYVAAFIPLLFHYYYVKKFSFRKTLFYITVLLVGGFFYGRISIVSIMVMISIGIFILFNDFKVKKTIQIVIPITLFGVLVVSLFVMSPELRERFSWALEPIEYYLKYGKVSTLSLNELSMMYSDFSPDLRTFLIGNGRWSMSFQDVWTFKMILCGGISLLMCYYTIGLAAILSINKQLEKDYGKGKMFFCLALVLIVIYEIKGGCIFYFISMYLPLLMSWKQSQKKYTELCCYE